MSNEPLMSVREAALMMTGTLLAEGPEPYLSSVAIDSRKVEPGSLFFALRGEKSDGHKYIGNAVSAGAVCCVIENENSETIALKENQSCVFILVKDTLRALQVLAREYRAKFENIFIVGITGSSGKTTTKELLASILAKENLTVMNEGNLNSETGLPLSIFRIRPAHRFGVFEMGINHAGEMDVLVDILRPDYAVLTNIGTAHIGLFGSKERIANEKMKIFHSFGNLKAGIVYENDDFTPQILADSRYGKKISLYGLESQKNEVSVIDKGLSGTEITLGKERIAFPLIGNHNLLNALAALKAAEYLGIDDVKIKEALEEAKPLFGRGEITNTPVTVISDCYNSNLESVKAALDFLDSIPWSGRKAVLLGSILELGDSSDAIHNKVADMAAQSCADAVFLFGKEIEKAYNGLSGGKKDKHIFWTDDPGKMNNALSGYLCTGDIILLKGSRGMSLERFLEIIGKINRKVPNC
ncbi:MAG: UDP-N-acetylmuramoyl-tripeptide--D-alanyl-D-alanine ligase [Spirochaetales bacterium]|nr:UDP-N-acetylmuramoyl-tripeptide--D-alanyl-D-alanine ligase [Spirochaetales bacterium]